MVKSSCWGTAVVLFACSLSYAQIPSTPEAEKSTAATPTVPLSQSEQLQADVQQICPVTGAKLGSTGVPIKVRIGQQYAFLCGKACQSQKVDATHWQTIQTHLAMAQGICPIMEKPVDANMKSTVIQGYRIFVCCPPCIAKIQAGPESAMEKVIANYRTHVDRQRQIASDQSHLIAQGICPVSGRALKSLDEAVKVQAGPEEVAFLCSQHCVEGKIKAEYWKTVQSNLAKAQKICPVMEQAVDSSMKSIVVNGRRIFVCCPPCIDKIKADPATYLEKLNQQIDAQK